MSSWAFSIAREVVSNDLVSHTLSGGEIGKTERHLYQLIKLGVNNNVLEFVPA